MPHPEHVFKKFIVAETMLKGTIKTHSKPIFIKTVLPFL